MIDADDRDLTGVVGSIAAAAFTVVVAGIGVEAGTGVVRVAFAFG